MRLDLCWTVVLGPVQLLHTTYVEIKLNSPQGCCDRVWIFAVVSRLSIIYLDQGLMGSRGRYSGDSTAKCGGMTDLGSVKKEFDTMGFNELQYGSLGHS